MVRRGLTALLLFAPLAYGSVEPWSRAILTIAVSLLAVLWLGRYLVSPPDHLPGMGGLGLPAAALAALVALQFLPLPPSAVSLLSPAAAKLHETAARSAVWSSLSISSRQTLQAASWLIVPLTAFFLVLNTVKTRKHIRRMSLGLVLIGSSVALFGIIQKLTWNGKIYWVKSLPPTNAFGPYVNRNHFAGLMVMLVPFALGIYLSLHHRRGDTGRAARAGEAAVLLMLITMSAALLMTASRGGIISMAAGLCFMAAAATVRFSRSRGGIASTVKRLWILGGAGTALSFAFLTWSGFFQRFTSDPGIGIRWNVWMDSLRAAWAFRLAGSGLGTYEMIFPLYKTVQTRYIYTHAHNEYLQAGVEGGTLLLIVIAFAAALYFRKCWQMISRRHDREVIYLGLGAMSGVAALLFNGLLDFNFRIPANALFFAVLAALSMSVLSKKPGT